MHLGGRYLTEEELGKAGFKKCGKNVKIHERASIYCTENISLGDNIRIDDFCVIIATGGVTIGSYVQLCNYCFLGASYGIEIDDFSTLAPGVKLFSSSDDYSGRYLTNPTVPRELTGGVKAAVRIEKHVILGAGSIVLPGCTIAQGCAIGALTLIKKSTKPWGIYAGVPAIRINARRKDMLELENKLKGSV